MLLGWVGPFYTLHGQVLLLQPAPNALWHSSWSHGGNCKLAAYQVFVSLLLPRSFDEGSNELCQSDAAQVGCHVQLLRCVLHLPAVGVLFSAMSAWD